LLFWHFMSPKWWVDGLFIYGSIRRVPAAVRSIAPLVRLIRGSTTITTAIVITTARMPMTSSSKTVIRPARIDPTIRRHAGFAKF